MNLFRFSRPLIFSCGSNSTFFLSVPDFVTDFYSQNSCLSIILVQCKSIWLNFEVWLILGFNQFLKKLSWVGGDGWVDGLNETMANSAIKITLSLVVSLDGA